MLASLLAIWIFLSLYLNLSRGLRPRISTTSRPTEAERPKIRSQLLIFLRFTQPERVSVHRTCIFSSLGSLRRNPGTKHITSTVSSPPRTNAKVTEYGLFSPAILSAWPQSLQRQVGSRKPTVRYMPAEERKLNPHQNRRNNPRDSRMGRH